MRKKSFCLVTYFIFTLASYSQDPVLYDLQKLISKNSIYKLDEGYSSDLKVVGDDLVFECFEGKQEITSVRIGPGGSISRWLFNGQELVAPPFAGEITDRVIQWTVWSDSIKAPVESGAGDLRYNMTQAGTSSSYDLVRYPNSVASIHMCVWYESTGVLDIYSHQPDQWLENNQRYIKGGITSLTRYAFVRDAKLLVRRFLLMEPTYVESNLVFPRTIYLEGWTPLSRSQFNALAIAVDSDGLPAWYYHADFNIPNYPAFPANSTYGYAVSYILPSMIGPKMCVIFGTQDPVVDPSIAGLTASSVLNCMSWDTGIGILPAIQISGLNDLSSVLVNQNLILYSTDQAGAAFKKDLDATASIVPRNSIGSAGYLGAETDLVRNVLTSIDKNNGKRLVKLGSSLTVQSEQYQPSAASLNLYSGVSVSAEIGDIIEIWSSVEPEIQSSWVLEGIFVMSRPNETWYDPNPVLNGPKKFYRTFRKN